MLPKKCKIGTLLTFSTKHLTIWHRFLPELGNKLKEHCSYIFASLKSWNVYRIRTQKLWQKVVYNKTCMFRAEIYSSPEHFKPLLLVMLVTFRRSWFNITGRTAKCLPALYKDIETKLFYFSYSARYRNTSSQALEIFSSW